MSNDEILDVLSHLFKSGCTTEILGCNPSKLMEDEKSTIVEASRNLLFQRSHERNELLRWIDSRLFNQNVDHNISNYQETSSRYLEQTTEVKERLSCLLHNASDEFFGEAVVQVIFWLR